MLHRGDHPTLARMEVEMASKDMRGEPPRERDPLTRGLDRRRSRSREDR